MGSLCQHCGSRVQRLADDNSHVWLLSDSLLVDALWHVSTRDTDIHTSYPLQGVQLPASFPVFFIPSFLLQGPDNPAICYCLLVHIYSHFRASFSPT